MSDFSPSDAAFEGFRVTREKPLSVLAWASIFALAIILAAVLIATGFAPRISGAANGLNSTDPQALITAFAKLAPVVLAIFAVWIGLSGVIGAAIYRRVLTPADSARGYLRFGRDELRQVGALFLCIFGAMVFTLALNLLLILPMRLAMAVAGERMTVFVAEVMVLVLQIWFGLRLSLLPAMTFAVKKIDVVGAWQLTRGQFWRLLGMMALAITLAALVYFLISAIMSVIAVIITGGDIGVISQLHSSAVDLPQAATIAVLVYVLSQLLTSVLLMVIVQAPTAVAYRALAEGAPADAGDI